MTICSPFATSKAFQGVVSLIRADSFSLSLEVIQHLHPFLLADYLWLVMTELYHQDSVVTAQQIHIT